MTAQSASALSPLQAEVIVSLASGVSPSDAARAYGVARSTIYRWLDNPAFNAELTAARDDYQNFLREKITELKGKALTSIAEMMIDPSAPHSVRLRAALALVDRPVEELMSCVPPDPLAVAHISQEDAVSPEPADETEWDTLDPVSQSPATECDTLSAKSQPVRVTKIGRNHPCPCNSGRKYKHCCLNRLQQAA